MSTDKHPGDSPARVPAAAASLFAALSLLLVAWLFVQSAERGPSIPTPPVTSSPVEAPPDTGTIRGRIVYEGTEFPRLPPLVKQGAVDVKDARIAARREIPDESLLVDQESRGVANGFVYLRNVPKNPSGEPWTLPTEVVTVRIDGCRYFPHAAIFTTNQVVQVINEDPLSHGLHYFPVRNPTGLLPIPPAEPMTPLQFKIGEKIPFEIRCDFYPWQKCFWLVLEHPFAALSNAEGEFCITGLPPGTHSITIWHETSGYIERNLKVEVVAGGTTDIGSILMIRR